MSRRIDIDAGEIGPPIDEIIRHIEDGSVHELVIRRDGREVARLSRFGAPAPAELSHEPRRYAWDHAREAHAARRGGTGGFLANLIGLGLAGGVLAFVLAPGYAFFALRSAALTGDVPALAELVDYPAVRSSLRPQLSDDPRADEPEPSWIENPIEAIRRRLGEAAQGAAAPEVDAYLTPQALAGLTFGEGLNASERTRVEAEETTLEASDRPWPGLVHWDPGRARLRIRDAGGSETIFTFSRDGVFRWRLSHIGLPEGTAAEPVVEDDSVPPAG